jgi:plasmid stabilization system protein ParE
MRLSFNAEARSELDAAQEHYFRISPELALGFLDEVGRGMRNILDSPLAWPPYTQKTRRYLLHRFPYHLVYRVIVEQVAIVAVSHEKRDPSYWLPRVSGDKP